MAMRAVQVLVFLLAAAFAGDALALRCDGRVVTMGDFDFQVRERCGDPYWISRRPELLIAGAGSFIERRVERVSEEWFYNFGPSNLAQRLVFVDGRLQKIDTTGYGRSRLGGDCPDTAFSRGISVGELVLRCGPPASRLERYQDMIIRDGLGNERLRPVYYEEWRYVLPRSRFVRNAIFIDGRLHRVDNIEK